jgi:hypothetical protein
MVCLQKLRAWKFLYSCRTFSFVMCYVHRVFYCAVFVACRQCVLGVVRTGAVVFMEFLCSLNFTENLLTICPTY